MKTAMNLLKAKMNVVYVLGATLAIILSVISCTKEDQSSNSNGQSDNAKYPGNPSALTSHFLGLSPKVASQTLGISCTCTGNFTLNTTISALDYGTVTSTTVPLSNANFSVTLQKNQYYYVIPSGGTYGNNTSCLKVKFITGNILPQFIYNPLNNAWSSLQTNSDIVATTVIKTSVPSCTICYSPKDRIGISEHSYF